MKLYYSAASPYVRKVLACAIAGGVDGQITRVDTNPHVSPPDLLRDNPLSKVPCLVTSDGLALFDSPVICEYLDSIGSANLFPPPGPARWRALKLQAIGDGIMDAAVARRMDQGRPQEAARDAFMARQAAAVERALDLLEADLAGPLADWAGGFPGDVAVPRRHEVAAALNRLRALRVLDLRRPAPTRADPG